MLEGEAQADRPVIPKEFYIFIIITDDIYRNLILIITLTSLAVLNCMSFIFTIFAYVARHVELTRSSTVSTSTRNVLAAPCFASPFPSPTAGSRHSYHRQAGLTCQQCLSPPVNQSGNQSKGERSIHPSAQLDHNGKQSINEFVDFWLVFLFFTGNFVKYF